MNRFLSSLFYFGFEIRDTCQLDSCDFFFQPHCLFDSACSSSKKLKRSGDDNHAHN